MDKAILFENWLDQTSGNIRADDFLAKTFIHHNWYMNYGYGQMKSWHW